MRYTFAGLALALVAVAAAACGTAAPTTAQCAYIEGDGGESHDSRVHDIVYQGQRKSYDDQSEVVRYFPCNSRNYIINALVPGPNGQLVPPKNANGDAVGDRHIPTEWHTNTGTKVQAYSETNWTLNQSEPALLKFHDVALKYNALTGRSQSGNVNFSSPGWNGMLGEVLSPAIDESIAQALEKFDDRIWKNPTTADLNKLSKLASGFFAANVRAKTGYSVDLFCGSGNSTWDQKHEKFFCSTVRIKVKSVVPASKDLQNNLDAAAKARQELEANAKLYAAAQAKYGNQAGFWLGLQDSIEKCNQTNVNCVVVIGGGSSSPAITLPSATTPTTGTKTKK